MGNPLYLALHRQSYFSRIRSSQTSTIEETLVFYLTLKRDHTEIRSLNTLDGLLTDDTEKTAALNTQFKSVFTYGPDGPLPDKGPSPIPEILDISITVPRWN